MKPLRVTILSEDFPPYPGGIAQWARGMADALHQLGHQATVLTRFRGDSSSDIPDPTPYPVEWIHGRRWQQFRTAYCRQAVTRHLREKGDADILLATTWNVARGTLGLARRRGMKVVTVVHGLEVTRKMAAFKRRWLRRTLESSNRVVAVSGFSRDMLVAAHEIPFHQVVVIPNGVDTRRFFPREGRDDLRKRYGLEGKKVVLTLARIIERKGQDRVVAAWPQVASAIPDARYLICGPHDEAYLQTLKKKIEEVGVRDQVILGGYVAPEDLIGLYNLCDVYIMASRELTAMGDTEGFGITFLEANACGKPVVGGDSGGVSDAIVDGETGFLVDPDNIDEIAEKLILLLGDPALAVRLGEQGRGRVSENYTWKKAAQHLLEAL